MIASAGVIRILMQASETIIFILPEGDEPGLKSEAKATLKPPSIIARAGGYGISRKKAAPGSIVGIVPDVRSTSISSAPMRSR